MEIQIQMKCKCQGKAAGAVNGNPFAGLGGLTGGAGTGGYVSDAYCLCVHWFCGVPVYLCTCVCLL